MRMMCWCGRKERMRVWNRQEQLLDVQRMELKALLGEFSEVIQDRPGQTTLAEHNIECGTARPVRLPPYRLPHAYRETVRQEIREMLEQGIIEPSSSEWSSPIVLVKKKDGSIRLCVDYRRLNSVSEMDAYPMPRVDDLVDRLGKATYMSTLDLTRGYWQVPVAEAARSKTAFATPFGLYQFNVMPPRSNVSWTRLSVVWRTFQWCTWTTWWCSVRRGKST